MQKLFCSALLISLFISQDLAAQSSVTVRLPKATNSRSFPGPTCSQVRRNLPASSQLSSLACLVERAKYKCTPIAKSGRSLKGVGSFYGKGDKFTGGATRCEKPFFPETDKILALQDSLIPRDVFLDDLCGRKAVVIAIEPDTGKCVSTEVELSDTGNLGARDPDKNNNTRDILKQDEARAGKRNGRDREIAGVRAFDLSYAAARTLRYADGPGIDDGRSDGKAFMEVIICKEMAPSRLTPGATRELERRARSKK